eukprot:gb/GECG01003134.1/.p1 GENE.gb/GECG01003134.1/~~gb/GECG01003134.1/.p1  ORF type:complete len:1063 (+),score=59.60 gb/GECG01003134.1/:1-3189(+)
MTKKAAAGASMVREERGAMSHDAGGKGTNAAADLSIEESYGCVRALGEFMATHGFATMLSLCFVFAFASLFPQIYGLYGTDGLSPFETQLSNFGGTSELLLDQGPVEAAMKWKTWSVIKHMPSLLWFSPYLGIPPDIMAAGLCILGILAAVLSTLQGGCGCMLLVAWISYLSIYQIDQVFLSFQWDILLLEVGFLGILYSPFAFSPSKIGYHCKRVMQPDQRTTATYRKPSDYTSSKLWEGYVNTGFFLPVQWLLRFALVKLMVMSGAVKLQAHCPTWNQLSATEYHFATQCIPTPAAWYLAQIPPSMHSLFTAAMFVIELPAPLLLLSPFATPLRIGAILQILLQMAIIVSGNYNFFNILTIILAVACWRSTPKLSPRDAGNTLDTRQLEHKGVVHSLSMFLHALDSNVMFNRLLSIASFGFLSVATYKMFRWVPFGDGSLPLYWWQFYGWKLSWDPSFDINRQLDIVLPHVVSFITLMVLISFLFYVSQACGIHSCRRHNSTKRRFSQGIRIFWGFLLGGIYLGAATGHIYTLRQPTLLKRAPSVVKKSLQGSFNWHISSGYGLFRRMTGVAHQPKDVSKAGTSMESRWEEYLRLSNAPTDTRLSGSNPWYDIWNEPVSIVARPEVEISGSNDGITWSALPFYYKPQWTRESPPWVIPHQPRVDWQMWFAALGSYQSAPWLIHLALKVLQGSPDVIRLLSHPNEERANFKWPFGWENRTTTLGNAEITSAFPKPPRSIKADKFIYDFTRIDSELTPWNRRLPPVTCISEQEVVCGMNNETLRFLNGTKDQRWWARSKEGNYLPRVTESALLDATSQLNWRRILPAERLEIQLRRYTCNCLPWQTASKNLFKSVIAAHSADNGPATIQKTLLFWKTLGWDPLVDLLPPVDWSLGMGLEASSQIRSWNWGTSIGSSQASWVAFFQTAGTGAIQYFLNIRLFGLKQSSVNLYSVQCIEKAAVAAGKALCQLQKFGQLLLYPGNADVHVTTSLSMSQATWLEKSESYFSGALSALGFMLLLPFVALMHVSHAVSNYVAALSFPFLPVAVAAFSGIACLFVFSKP